MTRTVVLGGSGFIGRWLCRELMARGREVAVLDKRPNPEPVNRYEPIDLENTGAVARLIRPGDIVVHLYHSSMPAESMADPEAENQKNVVPYARLLDRLADAGAGLLVYSSTGGQIYGHADRLPIPETAPANPITPYGRAKLEMEDLTREAADRGLPHLILRIGNPYGPHQELTNRHGVVPALFRAAITGATFIAYGGGTTVRDYVYVEDAAKAIAGLIESGSRNRTVNIGTGLGVPLSRLIEKIEQTSGSRINTVSAALRGSDVRENVLDVSLLSKLTGFAPRVGLEQGLELTWQHLRDKWGRR